MFIISVHGVFENNIEKKKKKENVSALNIIDHHIIYSRDVTILQNYNHIRYLKL